MMENLTTFFTVRHNEVDDLRKAYYVEPISANIEMLLMMTINKLQRLDRINLYRAFASVNATRVIAGLSYKSLGHARLAEGITLTLKLMIKSQLGTLFHWKPRGEQVANSMDLDDSDSVVFPPNTAIIDEGRLWSVMPNHLYVPKVSNQVGFVSLCQVGAVLYGFQFTVTNNHDSGIINKDIEECLSTISRQLDGLRPKENWRFVFITPPGCEVEKSLEGVTLYSAHLEIE